MSKRYNNKNIKGIDNHIYAYIRISTNKQTTESQLNELNNYCESHNYNLNPQNIIIDEGVSGSVKWTDRKINDIMNKIKKNDIIIVPEISRIGRNMNEVNEIIAICDRNKVKIIDIKNNLTLDGSFQSNMMASLYSMFSQMERQIISERVKQGLVIAKEKGHLYGRKRGIKKNKLDDKINLIIEYSKEGRSFNSMAKEFEVSSDQVRKFMISRDIYKYYCYVGKGQHKSLKKIITM